MCLGAGVGVDRRVREAAFRCGVGACDRYGADVSLCVYSSFCYLKFNFLAFMCVGVLGQVWTGVW